jgi:hypothetical protein
MTIKYCRIYLEYDSPEISKRMARTHWWGISNWLQKKIKPLGNQLKGAEVKGVNIVNIFLYERKRDSLIILREWEKTINTFNVADVVDLQSCIEIDPLLNAQKFISMSSSLMRNAPWPQVRSIGRGHLHNFIYRLQCLHEFPDLHR